MAKNDKNPIKYYIGEIGIRKDNQFTITLSEYEAARIAKVVELTGLSIPKVLAQFAKPCSCCGCENFTITIPRGLLSTNKNTNGGNINSQKRNDTPTDSK